MVLTLVGAGAFAFFFAALLTLVVRAATRRRGLVVSPRAGRWHRQPTATLGGVAIFLAFFGSYLAFADKRQGIEPILLGALLLFLVGLVDDLLPLRPATKLIAQLSVSAGVVYFGFVLPWTGYPAVNAVTTMFWLVGITNAINLLDNMDGLAGGITAISCVFLGLTFVLNGQPEIIVLPMALGGAALGFLLFNFNPASIFMGDCGSMFLGFMLGSMALLSEYGRSRSLFAVLLTPVLILMIPIFDTLVVTMTRKLSGRPISEGGRDHTSHRLVALGMSERRAVMMLYLFATVSGGLALAVRLVQIETALLLVPAFALIIVFLGIYLGKVRIYDSAPEDVDNRMVRLVVGLAQSRRRVFEVLLDAVLIVLAYYAAYLLRFEADVPDQQMKIFIRTLPLVVLIQMPLFWLGGVYRGVWRYVSVDDVIVIGRSIAAAVAASVVVVFVQAGFQGPSRAVFVLDALLLFLFVGGSRVSFKLFAALLIGQQRPQGNAVPVLIYGAGDGGELLLRELLNNREYRYVPVGFIDDDGQKAGKAIHGCQVFDSRDAGALIRRHAVKEVLISSAKVPESQLQGLRGLGVAIKRMRIRLE